MPLSGDILGAEIQAIDNDYNDVAISAADLPGKRLERNKRIAWAIINHFKANADITVPSAGLGAPGGPVTGVAHGTITS